MKTQEEYSEMIEQAVASIPYPSAPKGLFEPIVYTLEGGGKRLRPSLLLAVCEGFGGDAQAAIPQAIGLEMFHNFTLLHDDVMDNADMRRGRPTVHRRWNASTAILSGDAMLILATQMIADCPPDRLPEVLALFNQTALEVCEGQQLDMDFESMSTVTEKDYIEMIRLKTSVLLACACKMGALLAGATKEQCKEVYEFGERLGLAFQLQDDYLDTYGDPALFGKEIGGDIVNEKKTWLWINAMDRAPEQMRHILEQRLTDYKKIAAIKALYDELGLPSMSHALIERYAREAVEALSRSGISIPAFTLLAALADKSTRRSH